MHDLTSGLIEFLVPFLLVGIGLYFRPAAIAAPDTLLLVGAVAIAAVVAQIGLGLGAVTDVLYGVVVSMSLLTSMVAPPSLKVAFRNSSPDSNNPVLSR